MLLPDDVLDYIFSFIQSDFQALEACSQSHSDFNRLVERYLYANVTLENNNFVTISARRVPIPQFMILLSDSPYIANYIRNLEVSISSDPIKPVQYLENISFILQRFSTLQKITLSLHSPYCIRPKWASLPEDFRRAFLDRLHVPSLKAVCISFVSGFPLTALTSSKSVKSLTIRGWEHDHDFVAKTSRYHRLEDLAIQHLNYRQGDLEKIIAWVQPDNLRSLDVSRLYADDLEQFSRFFSSCSNTLTSLGLHISPEFQTFSRFQGGSVRVSHPATAILSLSSLVCLERLTIHADLEFHLLFDIIEFRSPIPTIARLLETVRPLQHLTLVFNFHVNSHLHIPHNSETLWSPLVSLISVSPSPCVNLCVKTSPMPLGHVSQGLILSSLARCMNLTWLVEQGLLVITPAIPVSNPLETQGNINNKGKTSRRWLPNFWPFNKFLTVEKQT